MPGSAVLDAGRRGERSEAEIAAKGGVYQQNTYALPLLLPVLCCVVLLPERLRSDMVIFGRIYCEFDDPEQFKEYYVRPHSAPLALLHLCCCFCAAAYC